MRSRDRRPGTRLTPRGRGVPATGRLPHVMASSWILVILAAGAAIAIPCALPAIAAAATPAPSQPAAGDPRSSGQGPGLVGDPLTAVIVVAAIAVLTIAATLIYVRATAGRNASPFE